MMDILRKIRVILDPKSGRDLEQDTKEALDKGTDPKTPKKNLSAIESAMASVKKAALGLGAAIAGAFSIKAIQSFLSSSVQASIELETSRIRLTQALRNEGIAFDDVSHSLAQYTKQLWDTHRLTEGEINPVLQQLITITGDYDMSLRGVGIAADLAAAANMDVGSAARLLGRVMNGETAALRRYGITIEEGTDALDQLEDKLKGMALAATPATEALRKAFGDLKEEIGFAFREATGFDDKVQALTGRIVGLKDNTELLRRTMRELVRAVRDLAYVIGIAGAVKAVNAFRAAATLAGGSVQLLTARLRALQLAMGPGGWLILGLSAVAIGLQRAKDRLDDVAEAAKRARDELYDMAMMGETALARAEMATVETELDAARKRLAALKAQEAPAARGQFGVQAAAYEASVKREQAVIDRLEARYRALTDAITAAAMSRRMAARPDRPEPADPTEPVEPTFIRAPQIRELGKTAEQANREWAENTFQTLGRVTAIWGSSVERVKASQEAIADAMREANYRMLMAAEDTAWRMTDAFTPFFEGLYLGFAGIQSLTEGLKENVAGIGAAIVESLIEGRAQEQMAAGTAALASGTWPPNPAAIKAATLHFAAAAAYRAIPGAIRSAGRGGAGAGTSIANPGSTVRPTAGSTIGPDINIYIDGVDPRNPRHQALISRTANEYRERTGGRITVQGRA